MLDLRPPEIELRTEAQSPSSVTCNEYIPRKIDTFFLGGVGLGIPGHPGGPHWTLHTASPSIMLLHQVSTSVGRYECTQCRQGQWEIHRGGGGIRAPFLNPTQLSSKRSKPHVPTPSVKRSGQQRAAAGLGETQAFKLNHFHHRTQNRG